MCKTIKLGTIVSYLEGLLTSHIALSSQGLQGYVINENHYISTTRSPMATKTGRVGNYLEGLLLIKSPEV